MKRFSKAFYELADKVGPMPSGMLALPVTWTFHPEELTTDELVRFVEGELDSLNDDDKTIAEEREAALAELKRRGWCKAQP